MIIVDAYSTDKTLDIVSKFFPNPTIIRTRQPLAQARKMGISHVETEWFAFIDSDILLFSDWFKLLGNLKAEDVGGIQGKDQYANESLIKYSRWQDNIWKKRVLHETDNGSLTVDLTSFRANNIRGLTHNTLIRTSCVKDWNPPSGLHIGEDHHLFLHVIKKGYKWVILKENVCLHYAFLNLTEIINRGLLESHELDKITRCGYINRNELWIDYSAINCLKLFIISVCKSLIASIYENDPRILVHKMCFYGSLVIGYLTKYNTEH